MNQVMTVTLYGASLAEVEGRQFASLYIGQHVENEQEEGAKGIVIMKTPCDPEVYKSLDLPKYPASVEAHIRLKRVAGGKMGQHCVKVVPKTPASTPKAS